MSAGRPAAEPAGPRGARIAGPTKGPAPPPAAQPPPAARTRLPGAGTYHTFRTDKPGNPGAKPCGSYEKSSESWKWRRGTTSSL
jgi:hypothetical protein